MINTDKEYRKIIESLKRSIPDAGSTSDIEAAVMNSIRRSEEKLNVGDRLSDFLFGWMDITWIRRSLITASIVLLGFFVWQQNSIINQIDDLNYHMKSDNRIIRYDPSSALERNKSLIRLSRQRSNAYYVPEEDLKTLLDSLDHLNIRYRKIMQLINNDPELKKIVEEQLDLNLQPRIKL